MENGIAELERRLAAVEERLSTLEGTRPGVSVIDASAVAPDIDTSLLSNAPTHIGRVLLIFGGAFLLRAITDEKIVATAIGILLGSSYALFWLWMAYRSAGDRSKSLTSLFYGASSVLLALPLFVEATTRFDLLSGRQSVVALVVFCALTVGVAIARNLRSLCWVVTAGSIATAFVILNTTHSASETAIFLLLLGFISLWAVYRQEWPGVQWLGALGANSGVAVLLVLSASDRWSVQALTPVLLASLLLVTYLGSFAVRTHIHGRDIRVFEVVQGLLIIGLLLLAVVVASRIGTDIVAAAGGMGLVLSAIAYALAFAPQTRTERGRNYHFYSSIGLLLLVGGSVLAVPAGVAAAGWSVLALAIAWFSGRYDRITLSLQCTFLLIAASIGSGILATGSLALVGDAVGAWPTLRPLHILVALTTVACLFIPVAQRSDRWGVFAGLPQLVVLALSVWEVGGLMVVFAAPLFAHTGSGNADLAVLAALRTGILAAASVTLAVSSRFRRWPEARWLVYPVLILVGFKLFLDDFPNGRPVTLFVAFALIGSALMLVAKLLRPQRPVS